MKDCIEYSHWRHSCLGLCTFICRNLEKVWLEIVLFKNIVLGQELYQCCKWGMTRKRKKIVLYGWYTYKPLLLTTPEN